MSSHKTSINNQEEDKTDNSIVNMQSSIKKKSTSNYEHFDSYNELFEQNLAKLESPVKQIMGETGN